MDAPEARQTCTDAAGAEYACGATATNALKGLIGGAMVACQGLYLDRYGRTVARCTAGGEDLGGWMVRHGYALDYSRYSHGAYLAAEMRARAERAGMWAGTFARPEDWRRGH
jgi:endonuclease YncB( thermonuclease family)